VNRKMRKIVRVIQRLCNRPRRLELMVHLWALLGVTETEIICCKDYEKVVFKMEEEGVSCKTERQGLSISALLDTP